MKRKITHIIVHCSDSTFGDTALIDKWHREQGWLGVGYHYVILNGKRTSQDVDLLYDGLVEDGRDINQVGSHAKGYNQNSIGICLIGKREFSKSQLYSLLFLLKELIQIYNIPVQNILGHYETELANGKTCPNFEMSIIRTILRDNLDDVQLYPYDKEVFNFI